MNYTKLTITIISMLLVAGLTWFALSKGIDGYYFFVGIILVAGLGGFGVNEILNIIKSNNNK